MPSAAQPPPPPSSAQPHHDDNTIIPMPHQVGGHRPKTADEPPYMLRLLDPSSSSSSSSPPRPRLLKVVQPDAKGEREVAFYQRCFFPPTTTTIKRNKDAIWQALRPLVPTFYGLHPMPQASGLLRRYLILEDLSLPPPTHPPSHSTHHPSILDVKIGRVTAAPWASAHKVAKEQRKYVHQRTLGFRIVGMKLWVDEIERYEHEEKGYGRTLSPDDVPRALRRFFCRRKGLVGAFVARLERVEGWFARQRCLRFWSSSLLFVDHGVGEEEKVDVRMIDFAHVQMREEEEEEEEEEGGWEEGDGNYVYGLVSLLRHLKALQREEREEEKERRRK